MARRRRHTVPGTHSTGLTLKQLRKLGSVIEGGDTTGPASTGAVNELGRQQDAARSQMPAQYAGRGSVTENPHGDR